MAEEEREVDGTRKGSERLAKPALEAGHTALRTLSVSTEGSDGAR